MKTGRNDPCPCGSGRKFKKCCSGPSTGLPPNLDLFELNRKIAYLGAVGRERKQWCEAFLFWKTKTLGQMEADLIKLAVERGKSISCRKGCSFCCSQHICATLQECEAIVFWLYQHDNERRHFLSRYPIWRNKVSGNNVFEQLSKDAASFMNNPLASGVKDAFMKTSDEYRQLDIPCPFLVNNACSIYPIRPLVCASCVSLSPSDECRPSSATAPYMLIINSDDDQPQYFRGAGKNRITACAPLLVHEILKYGYDYLSNMPGLLGLDVEAFGDPAMRALISK